ncbi:pilus assembly protein Flp/PilA [Sphingomonas palmae]|uniref:Pilus assembly protein Flp/PilA n=1 Tax=Sphingomonas palmae TaxID=1855283 RepID=A0A1H7H7Y3_9SPHN|nr:Flp family type IVb pilin [Sphingomonas palmae]SEK45412.1 pilus assembly protein Flp/PilA [Sphingomonas palmae]
MQQILAFLKNNKGATAIEYGLIAALIAVAAMTAMSNLGGSIKNTFATVGKKMDDSATTAPTAGTSKQ